MAEKPSPIAILAVLAIVLGGAFLLFLSPASPLPTVVNTFNEIFNISNVDVNTSGVEGHFNVSATVTGTLSCAAGGDSVFLNYTGTGGTVGALETVKDDWDLLGSTFTQTDPSLLGDIGETIWVIIDVPVVPFLIVQAFLLSQEFDLFDFGVVFDCP